MKVGMRWMALAVAVLVSTSAWAAIWNPDTDAALLFNMNFQTYNNTLHTTTDAEHFLVGVLADFNTASPNVFGEPGRAGLGVDANFAELHDLAPGDAIPGPNDCKLVVPSDGTFDMGFVAVKSTWTFWFNVPNLEGTIIRHQDRDLTPPNDNLWWEIRIHGGKLHFRHQNNSLRMETASALSDLGITVNEWHSAAIVIDRTDTEETSVPTTQLSTKIYIDGLEVPIIVTSVNTASMNVDIFWEQYESPLWIGAGEREFDGLLDDVRLFGRVLTPLEVSILNQPDATVPRALLPIPRSSNVVIATTLTWEPASGASTQDVYFGTNPGSLGLVKSGTGALNTVTNAELGGLLALNTQYYWYVKTNGTVNGPLWSFTTETGKAINISPLDKEEDVSNYDVNLIWATPTAATYTVYVSTNRTLVENNDIDVNVAIGISDPCVMHFDPCSVGGRGEIYYWRVNSTYASVGMVPGDIWSFRTDPYDLVFNTADYNVSYADRVIPAYACVDGNGWTTVTTAALDGNYMVDGNAIAVFNFPSGFNYDRRYDIIVVPQYRGTDIDYNTFPTPLSIRTTNFYFDGRIQIAGEDVTSQTQDIFARSGGFPGPKWNNACTSGCSVFSDRVVPVTDYWTLPQMTSGNHGRFGTISSTKDIPIPTALCKKTFGPGQPVNAPYKGGGGGGAGGVGGEAARGFFFGINTAGPSYGDEEVPIPFGGSAGGWGDDYGGAAGGGGIEIIATGNVVLDSNSQIIAHGGGIIGARGDYASGGGGGGSVKIVAQGSVTVKGSINVNGGKGGDASTGSPDNSNDTGGGGGGGRVAVFYGTTKDLDDGTITADGGAKGTDPNNTSLATDGQNGTILITSDEPNMASAPTPADGDWKVYAGAGSVQLKWYSGYCSATDTDVVYCDTFSPPTTPRGTVAATRGQHSVTMPVSAGNTYYWKVVSTGGVSSDPWSFTTVSWECPFAISNRVPHVGGPEWDFNHDCFIDLEDFAYFVENWLNSGFGQYTLDNGVFAENFADEWRMCDNRTDGCNNWAD